MSSGGADLMAGDRVGGPDRAGINRPLTGYTRGHGPVFRSKPGASTGAVTLAHLNDAGHVVTVPDGLDRPAATYEFAFVPNTGVEGTEQTLRSLFVRRAPGDRGALAGVGGDRLAAGACARLSVAVDAIAVRSCPNLPLWAGVRMD